MVVAVKGRRGEGGSTAKPRKPPSPAKAGKTRPSAIPRAAIPRKAASQAEDEAAAPTAARTRTKDKPGNKAAAATASKIVRKIERKIGDRSVGLSSLDKVLFPDGITKGELIDYYDAISARMLPYLRGRPLVLQRYPDGIDKFGFYQKEAGPGVPAWVKRVRVRKEGGWQSLIVCDDRATLVYLANQNAIVLHPWLSCVADVRKPDMLVLDLDPATDDFAVVRRAAECCRALFDQLAMPVFLKTSGSRGLHLVVPLSGGEDFDVVREVAARMAGVLARRHPKELTNEHRKAKRAGRVYLDIARNAYAQTAVAAYSVRALPGAPVSAPLAWEELPGLKRGARTFDIRNVLDRADPWKGWRRKTCTMMSVAEKLARLEEEERPTVRAAAAVGAKRRSSKR